MTQRTLKIPREEARTLFKQQIEKGDLLLSREIHTEEELAKYVDDRLRYNQVNCQMLERMFGEVIDVFWRFGKSYPSEWEDFDFKVKFYKEWDGKQVNELRGLEESLDLVLVSPMDSHKAQVLEAKLAALKVFVQNVRAMGPSMDDTRTREAYRYLYKDIKEALGDESLSIYAPNIQEGKVIGSATGKLWASHQTEIIDSGTRLIAYVESRLFRKEKPMDQPPQSKTLKQRMEDHLAVYTLSIVIATASVTFGIMKWYYGDYITNKYEATIVGIKNQDGEKIRELESKIKQLEPPLITTESKPVASPK